MRLLGPRTSPIWMQRHAAGLLARRAGGRAPSAMSPHRMPIIWCDCIAGRNCGRCIRSAMLRLLDSRVVALAARLLGLPAPRVAPGSDLTALLLARHLPAGERITIVGLSPQLAAGIGAPDAALTRRRTTIRRAASSTIRPAVRSGGRLRAGASGALRVSRGRFAAAGDAGSGNPRYRACHRGSGCALVPAWNSVAGAQPRAPRWMQRAGWSGCIGLPAIRRGWRGVIWWTARRSSRCCCVSGQGRTDPVPESKGDDNFYPGSILSISRHRNRDTPHRSGADMRAPVRECRRGATGDDMRIAAANARRVCDSTPLRAPLSR